MTFSCCEPLTSLHQADIRNILQLNDEIWIILRLQDYKVSRCDRKSDLQLLQFVELQVGALFR